MSKTASCKTVKPSSTRLSPAAELKVIRKIAAVVKKDPAMIRDITVAAGIHTADGRLRKAFGGKA